MSQTVVPVAPPAPPDVVSSTNPPTLAGRVAALRTFVRKELSRTPGQLRMVSGLAVLAMLVVAIGGAAALRERSSALDEARDAASHLVLVQGVQTSLATANADATNSFLGFGLEPESQRLDYIAQIDVAGRDLGIAARTTAADAATLGYVNAQLARYTGYIASARANNRQGLPVGANYLSVASGVMNDNIVPKLDTIATADQKRVDDALARAGNARWWLTLVIVVGLGGLIAIQVWLARRSRRYFNAPLAAATAVALVALLLAGGAMVLAQSRANDVADGSLKDTINFSTSRVSAFAAKSQESLTLIDRGSATDDDKEWNDDIDKAFTSLPRTGDARSALQAYVTAHQAINKLDVAGNWDEAVKQATASGSGSANALFVKYAQLTEGDLAVYSVAATDGLDDAGSFLLPAGLLVLLLGLVAAAGAWWGVSLRLDEYR